MDSTDSIYKLEVLQRISLVSDFPENRLLITIYHRNDYDGGWWMVARDIINERTSYKGKVSLHVS
jgi:hypothetical protein